jgi:PAS domain S-box-containing protein
MFDSLKAFWQRHRHLLFSHYASSLYLAGIMVTAVFLLVGTGLDNQRGNLGRIKLAAEVIGLTEGVKAEVLNLANAPDTANRSRLLDTLIRLGDAHGVLISGQRVLPTKDIWYVTAPGSLSDDLKQLYFGPADLNRKVQDFIGQARKLASSSHLSLKDPEVQSVLRQADALLPELRRALELVEQQTSNAFEQSLSTFNLLYVVMVAGLLAIGQLVLKPLVLRLEETIGQLKRERDFTTTVLNTAQAFIALVDDHGQIRLTNEYAQAQSGWMAEELVGQNFFERFLPPADRPALTQQLEQLRAGELLESILETPLRIRSGELLTVMWHNSLLKGENDETLFLLTGIDITERKQAEAKLRHTLQELERLSRRQSEEIQLAANLQRAMLPPPEIRLPGLNGHAHLATASEVSGDYYDYYAVDGRYSVVLVGDATGHGVGAGSLVTAVKAAVHQLSARGVFRPAEVLTALNDIVAEVGHESLFMTLACLTLDAREGRLWFGNAGHVLPYCRNLQGQWTPLESYAPPLGYAQGTDYRKAEMSVPWQPGGRLVIFTDGLVEAASPLGEAFGYQRLEKLLEQAGDLAPESLCQAFIHALRQHSGRDHLEDDVSVVVLEYQESVLHPELPAVPERLRLLPLSRYRRGERPEPELDRRWFVLHADGPILDCLPDIERDRILRVLPVDHPLYHTLPFPSLLAQHVNDSADDLFHLLGRSHWRQRYELTHTDDKAFILDEIQALALERGCSQEAAQKLVLVADEMLENAFYAAPRDGRSRPLYDKGQARALDGEHIALEIAQRDQLWGLMVTDTWGTLSADCFLHHLSQAAQTGVTPGLGGAGLFMMWELSHYLQVRVAPYRFTHLVALWDVEAKLPVAGNTGFQYFQ